MSTSHENPNVLTTFQTTFQYQIYCTSILWFSSCMHKDGQMDTWHSYFTSHFTGKQTCLKQAWQIRSHVTKWKYFNTTGVLCATNFNLKNFLFYTNTEENKMRSLGCQYNRWQTDAPLCDETPIYRVIKHNHPLICDEEKNQDCVKNIR